MVFDEFNNEPLRAIHKGRVVVHVVTDDHYILMAFVNLYVNCKKCSLLVIPMSRLHFPLSHKRVIFSKIHLHDNERLIA